MHNHMIHRFPAEENIILVPAWHKMRKKHNPNTTIRRFASKTPFMWVFRLIVTSVNSLISSNAKRTSGDGILDGLGKRCRSEERRVGKECVSRCRYRWW